MRNKKISIIAIALVILLAVGAEILVLKNNEIKKQEKLKVQQQEEAKKIEEEKQTAQEDSIDISDWKTYRNEKYGFEVKYPEDWIIDNENSILYIHSISSRDNMPEGGGTIILEATGGNLQNFIKEYEASDPPHSKIIKQEKYIIDGISVDKLVMRTAIGIDRSVIFVGKNKKIIITFQDFDKYHIKILSTLKFIN